MIRITRQLPEIYLHESRDFQVLARAYEVVYNYLKTNADAMEQLPFGRWFDRRLLELMALTMGFSANHDYDSDDLMSVCSCFAEVLRNKGSRKAIETAIRAVLNAQRVEGEPIISKETDLDPSGYGQHLEIYIPYMTEDIVLLDDIMDYVLPAGMTYSFTFVNKRGGRGELGLFTDEATVKKLKHGSQLGTVADASPSRFDTSNDPGTLAQSSTGVVVSDVPNTED